MTLAIRLCVCIRSQYDAVHMPGKPSVMSDSGNILMTMTNTQEPQNTNTSGALAVAKAAAGLKLYDTASHAVSSFTPIKPGQVGIYVCGATVQSSPHIGHIRAAVAFDVVRRWFERLGYKVTFVRNVTDIDDKILDKAAAAGQQWWERAYIYEREFTEAYSKLGVEPPTYEPRATGHMIDMIDLIRRIIDNGHGYVVYDADGKPTGNVYFDVASWPHYGELTHQKRTAVSDAASEVTDAMGPSVDNAGNDKYNPVDPADASPDKHDPRDFALWKAPKDTDPEDARWSTPFGVGRPGWHIECSAMSHRYLGDGFDIHGGGLDLRFPHHENEMAQTRAAGYPSAARWMHSAWVTAKGEKMSKSLGTGLSVPSVLAEHSAWVVRYALGSVQYRSMLEWSDQALVEAQMLAGAQIDKAGDKPLTIRALNAPESLHGVDFSDHQNYWHFGYPALMVTDTSFMRNPHYHRSTDTWEKLDYQRMAQVVNAVLTVAHAAPAQRPLESRIVPDLLHGQHVGVQCPKALPQPGDLALKLGLAVRVLVLVEQATRVGQVEHIAGGHHQGVQRLGEFGGAHGGRAASLWSHGLQPPVSEAAAHGRTAPAARARPTVRHGPAPGPHRRPTPGSDGRHRSPSAGRTRRRSPGTD